MAFREGVGWDGWGNITRIEIGNVFAISFELSQHTTTAVVGHIFTMIVRGSGACISFLSFPLIHPFIAMSMQNVVKIVERQFFKLRKCRLPSSHFPQPWVDKF